MTEVMMRPIWIPVPVPTQWWKDLELLRSSDHEDQ